MLSINISELILTVVSFLALLFILKRLLYGPLISFMDARQAKIDAGLEQERLAEEKLRQAGSENELQLDETKKRAAELIAQGRAGDDRGFAEAADSAEKQAEEAAQRSRQAMDALREKSADRLRAAAPELTELLAKRLLND